MRGIQGKTAIVTGAGSGIGRAMALRLASEGVTVGVFGIRGDAATQTVAMIEAAGGTAVAVTRDIADYGGMLKVVAEFEAATSRGTEILVNNAGWDIGMPEDYPGLVAFLVSEDAAVITGQTISVSGGLTMHG